MRFRSMAVLVAALLLLVQASPVRAEDQYSPETLRIARKLLCPICTGETVADSQSNIAREMRDTIEQKVQAGESEQQILDFFVARYGESILTDPPKSGFAMTLWWLPVLVVLVGALAVGLFLRERTRTTGVLQDDPEDVARAEHDAELEAIAADVLGQPRAQGLQQRDGLAQS